MISFNKSDVISLFMKTTSKLYEAKNKMTKRSVNQLFDLLYANEVAHKSEKFTLKPTKNPGYEADQVFSTVDQEESKKKQPVLKGRMIKSERSEKILELLKKNSKNNKSYDSKQILKNQKSLGQVMWSLSMAQKAKINEGISPHDMSSLLEKTAELKLYPINISRTIYKHQDLIALKSQEKKTKRYALTPKGKREFKKLGLSLS